MPMAVVLINFTAYGYQDGNGSSPISTAAVNNVQPVIVDYGPTTSGHLAPYPNALFTTVTVCVPGTSTFEKHTRVSSDSIIPRIII